MGNEEAETTGTPKETSAESENSRAAAGGSSDSNSPSGRPRSTADTSSPPRPTNSGDIPSGSRPRSTADTANPPRPESGTDNSPEESSSSLDRKTADKIMALDSEKLDSDLKQLGDKVAAQVKKSISSLKKNIKIAIELSNPNAAAIMLNSKDFDDDEDDRDRNYEGDRDDDEFDEVDEQEKNRLDQELAADIKSTKKVSNLLMALKIAKAVLGKKPGKIPGIIQKSRNRRDDRIRELKERRNRQLEKSRGRRSLDKETANSIRDLDTQKITDGLDPKAAAIVEKNISALKKNVETALKNNPTADKIEINSEDFDHEDDRNREEEDDREDAEFDEADNQEYNEEKGKLDQELAADIKSTKKVSNFMMAFKIAKAVLGKKPGKIPGIVQKSMNRRDDRIKELRERRRRRLRRLRRMQQERKRQEQRGANNSRRAAASQKNRKAGDLRRDGTTGESLRHPAKKPQRAIRKRSYSQLQKPKGLQNVKAANTLAQNQHAVGGKAPVSASKELKIDNRAKVRDEMKKQLKVQKKSREKTKERKLAKSKSLKQRQK